MIIPTKQQEAEALAAYLRLKGDKSGMTRWLFFVKGVEDNG